MPSPNVGAVINNNSIDLSQYKGEISRCPACLPGQAALGTACRICLGHGFVAKCLNCNGTGLFTGRTVWDGGQNPHVTTCNLCGGSGFFPARKPADWKDREPVAEFKPPVPDAVKQSAALAGPFAGLSPNPRNLPPPPSMQGAVAVLPGGTVVK